MEIKKALVIGGGGFIGHNLVKKLKSEGWYVAVVDIKPKPDFEESPADMYYSEDARFFQIPEINSYDRVYQLGADMGGAGFVFSGNNDADILSKSVAINISVLNQLKEWDFKGLVFYSSSVCIYSPEATAVCADESSAYPASADSNYGWEKLYSERLYEAYARNYGINVRIARFNNCYGPHGVFEGGREKSPAAVCSKVIRAKEWISDNGVEPAEVEIWGNGEQVREFVYIDDLLSGIEAIMSSEITTPINIGPDYAVTINELVDVASKVEGKKIVKKYVDGPIGLQVRRTGNKIIKSLGWAPKVSLEEGITKTYNWIKKQKE